jgi:hypothetical protein
LIKNNIERGKKMKQYFIEYDANQYTPEFENAIIQTYSNSKNIDPFDIGGAIAKVFENLPDRYSLRYNRYDFITDLKGLRFRGCDLLEFDDRRIILIYWAEGLNSIKIYPCEY